MLCVTAAESDVHTLALRLEQAAEGDLHEVRLDALDRWDDDVFALLARHAPFVIATCRPARQGGHFAGAEARRIDILRRAAVAGVAHVDVEADVETADFADLRAAASSLLVSWHDPSGIPRDLAERARTMERDADVVKVAVTVDDAAELTALHGVSGILSTPHVLIGMGFPGLLSRVRFASFGSEWTYVAARAEAKTAPGQLTVDEARRLGLPASARTACYALLGGEQIAHSPGVHVYNTLFRERGRDWSYVPVQTSRAADCLDLLRATGVRGASVTMPNKHAALAASRPDDRAAALGAANTIRLDEDGWASTNTDGIGVRAPLERACATLAPDVPRRALVLGAGGAASAAVDACRGVGLDVTVAARNVARARAILDPRTEVIPWSDRTGARAAVLVNATPLAGATSPWPQDAPLGKSIVFDLAHAPEPSALLVRAANEGAHVIDALTMWIHQGAAQMTWLTGEAITPDDLARIATA